MEKREVVLAKEKETKGTFRYAESSNGQQEVFGYVYIRKAVLGNPIPEKLKITVEAL